jgi:Asp-tRNA(Asn)/Glu-tRNA(Gln) amidotransferase A subunit family amidase
MINRVNRLATLAALLVIGSCSGIAQQAERVRKNINLALKGDQAMMERDLLEVTIPKLQQYYSSGKYTAVEVIRWYLARIDKYNPEYNAFIKLFREQALERATELDADAKKLGKRVGVLWGVPIVVKGSISIAGEVTTVGWWGYTQPGLELRVKANATVIDRLHEQGAIILGHTNMPDLADSDTTNSSVAGRTGNAYAVGF